jgi:putative hydrolase of the HAD superfamily
MVSAVTFDYWNTLCCEPPGGLLRGLRLAGMREVLDRAGVGDAGVESELAAAYDAAWLRYHDAWVANRQYTGADAIAEITDHLESACGLPPALRRDLESAFHGAAAAGDVSLILLDGVTEVLRWLRAQDIRTAIVCDVGLTGSPVLRMHLERHGILDLFDAWAFSDEVGVYKPDPAIFHHALAGVGSPDPADCVHVGDRRRTDIAGAQALGMRAVRITAVYADDDPTEGPSGDVVVSSYHELLPGLGLASVEV